MAKKQPLYPHVPKSREQKTGRGFPLFTPTKKEEFIVGLLKVSEHLAYAYQSAIMRYSKGAITHVQIAQEELSKLGVDPEDLESVTEPLKAVSESMELTRLASRIDDAQEELRRYGPRWAMTI